MRTPIRRVHTYPGYGHYRAAVRPAFTARLTAPTPAASSSVPALRAVSRAGGPCRTQADYLALDYLVTSTLAAAQTRSQHSAGANTAAALAAGYHLAFAVGAGLAGAALVVATAVLRPSRRRAALAECC